MSELKDMLAVYQQAANALKSQKAVRDHANALWLHMLDEMLQEMPALADADKARGEAERKLHHLEADVKRMGDHIRRLARNEDDLRGLGSVVTESSQITATHWDDKAALEFCKQHRNNGQAWMLLKPDKRAFIEAKQTGAPIPDDVLRLTNERRIAFYPTRIQKFLEEQDDDDNAT